MPKISKNSNKTEQIRNRVRIFRGVQAILKGERNSNKLNLNTLNDVPSVINFTKHEPKKSLSDQLKTWAIEYHLTQRAVSKLLKILKSNGMNFLPKDCRTLMRTPRSIQIEKTAGGQLWYNGLASGLSAIFSKLTSNLSIQLNINVDGLPLFKSSPIEFWPMLATIQGDIHFFLQIIASINIGYIYI